MAKQIGDEKLTGTIDNLTFYKMEGEYYVRMKSSLTRKRFFKSAAFEGSRRSCKRLAVGSKLASAVYRSIPQKKRRYALFCELKSLAIRLLKEGRSEWEVRVRLEKLVRGETKAGERSRSYEIRSRKSEPGVVGVLRVRKFVKHLKQDLRLVEIGSLVIDRVGVLKFEKMLVVDAPG